MPEPYNPNLQNPDGSWKDARPEWLQRLAPKTKAPGAPDPAYVAAQSEPAMMSMPDGTTAPGIDARPMAPPGETAQSEPQGIFRQAPQGAAGPSDGALRGAGQDYRDEAGNLIRMGIAEGLAGLGGGPRVAAHDQPTTRSVTTQGVASQASIDARDAASGDRMGAEGVLAQQRQAFDREQSEAHQGQAARALDVVARLDRAGLTENQNVDKALAGMTERAARLEERSAADDPNQPGLAGVLARLREWSAGQEAGSPLMAINTGRDPNQALQQQAQGRAEYRARRDAGGSDVVRQYGQGVQVRNTAANVANEAYADFLTSSLKSREAEYRAQGRAPEYHMLLAQLEEKKAELRGAREAAMQGTTVQGSKYVPASGGGGGSPARRSEILLRGGQLLAGLGQQQDAAYAAGIGGGRAAQGVPTVAIQGEDGTIQRVPLDTTLPTAVQTKVYERAEVLADMQLALDNVKAAAREAGALRYAPGSASYSAAVQRYNTAVTTLTRVKSQGEGAGTINPGEIEIETGAFKNPLTSEGAIKAVEASLGGSRRRLQRTATGR